MLLLVAVSFIWPPLEIINTLLIAITILLHFVRNSCTVRMSIWICLNSFHINQHLRFYFQRRFNTWFACPCLHGECIWINLSWLELHGVLRDRDVIYRDKLRTVLWVCGSDFQKLHWHRSSASATRLVFGNLYLPTYVAIFGKFLSSFSTFHTNISVKRWDCKP